MSCATDTKLDRHFAGEGLDPLNQTLVALAAYNCGASRLRGLRGETTRRGLNPNEWFNNVERVTAERIGRETVQYVSNIYKYYIAYKLAEDWPWIRPGVQEETKGFAERLSETKATQNAA